MLICRYRFIGLIMVEIIKSGISDAVYDDHYSSFEMELQHAVPFFFRTGSNDARHTVTDSQTNRLWVPYQCFFLPGDIHHPHNFLLLPANDL